MKKSHPRLADVIDRNIKTLLEVRRQIDKKRSAGNRIADGITTVAGSLPFLYANIALFVVWLVWNAAWWLGIEPFDPYPFGLLTTMVSLEAIILSVFVLISQRRLSEIADQRADLDLQVDLLAEYETTKILKLVDAIANHLKIEAAKDTELEQLESDVSPETMLREMETLKHRRQI